MQMQQETDIQLAGEQVPLLGRHQLRPGIFLVAEAASHLWEVTEVYEERISMQRLPRGTLDLDHKHNFTPIGSGQHCTCGLRQQPITGEKGLLPLKPGRARFHIIAPREGTVMRLPQKYEVYAYLAANQTIKFLTAGTVWSEAVPIIPVLHKVWKLPTAMRTLLESQTQGEEVDVEIPF